MTDIIADADSLDSLFEGIANATYKETSNGLLVEKLWQGIVAVPKSKYYLVDVNHQLLEVIKPYAKICNIDIKTPIAIDIPYVKVQKTVIEHCIRKIYNMRST
jgi:hypothetical protein